MTNRKFWEGFIITAIILVLIQTFLDEYARFARWSVSARNVLLCAGFIFDLIFSVEFVVRSVISGKKNRFLSYIMYDRGWVDFLTSFPLLVLYSAPSVYLLVYGDVHTGVAAHGLLNVLKIVKAVRIARILRLLRTIKILGKIQNTESKMAQHHTSVAATTAVFTVICVLMLWSAVKGIAVQGDIEKRKADYSRIIEELSDIAQLNNLEFRETCENFLLRDANIVKVEYNSGYSYEKLSQSEFRKYFDEEDFFVLKAEKCTLIISVKDIESEISLQHMQIFFVIISLVFSFMLLYSRHFAQTVSDVAHILNKGFRKKDYNLMVKIRDEYREEELYRLAQFYNDAYLPAKLRRLESKANPAPARLSVKDLMDFGR